MLNINMEFVRGMLFIRLEGKLNNETCIELKRCIDKMIYEKELRYFVINLEKLDYIDDLGLRLLIDRYLDITLHDGRLIICGYDNKNSNNIRLSNLFNKIEHTNNELNALKLINY